MNSTEVPKKGYFLLVVITFLITLANSSVVQGESLDAVFANDTQVNRLCLGDDTGGFVCSDVSPDTNVSHAVVLGDLDGDKDLDAVFANQAGVNRVCLGNGFGAFVCNDVSSDTNASFGVDLGKIDGDKNLDAVFANNNVVNRVCLGDGSGGFITPCTDVSPDTNATRDVALGDMNNDGDLDAVFANNNQVNRVCLGDGSGGFTCNDVNAADTNATFGVALGDLDSNGALDAVFANNNVVNRVCLGDGSGGFTCNDVNTDTNATQDVALGDVDNDGVLDAVFANYSGVSRVCLGDGSGGFINPCSDVVGTSFRLSNDVALGDVNDDGDLDAVFANDGQENQVCLGDGNGGFTCSDVSSDTNASDGVALGDIADYVLDHFFCYKAKITKDTPKFQKGLTVSLSDQFEDKLFDVKKPADICSPELDDTDDTHMLSYTINQAKTKVCSNAPLTVCTEDADCPQPDGLCQKAGKFEKEKNIRVTNQLGILIMDSIRPERLFVPTGQCVGDSCMPPVPTAGIDHYKCYKVRAKKNKCQDDPTIKCKTDADCQTGKCNKGFSKGIEVEVVDKFDEARFYRLKKPTRLCTPVNKEGEGITDDETHLMCYTVSQVNKVCIPGAPQNEGFKCKKEEDCGGISKPKSARTDYCQKSKRTKITGIHLDNQFSSPGQVDTIREKELCVPSAKETSPYN